MMGSVCAEQQHKFHHSHQLLLTKKALRDIDIPPRKQLLLSRSPKATVPADACDTNSATSFSKFLPYNNVADDDDADPYSSDHFRMYEFKVRKCNRSRSHDWTDCPFAHPGEKARRRDPRRHHYSGSVCPDFRKGHCGKGDACELSHGVFECWLHPSRYRTEACKDGRNCMRKVCFFAHSSRQLRLVPDPAPAPAPAPASDHPKLSHHCCIYCHCTMTASPTSTLMAHMSPPLSPPISPYGRSAAYKDAMAELMVSFESMSAGEASLSPSTAGSLPWMDVNFTAEEQPQFVMSPTAQASRGVRKFYYGQSKLKFEDYSGEANPGGPDLGWVNDLLT